MVTNRDYICGCWDVKAVYKRGCKGWGLMQERPLGYEVWKFGNDGRFKSWIQGVKCSTGRYTGSENPPSLEIRTKGKKETYLLYSCGWDFAQILDTEGVRDVPRECYLKMELRRTEEPGFLKRVRYKIAAIFRLNRYAYTVDKGAWNDYE